MAVRLREKYQSEIVPALQQELQLASIMQVPHLKKIVVNIGVGEAIQNSKALDAAGFRETWRVIVCPDEGHPYPECHLSAVRR